MKRLVLLILAVLAVEISVYGVLSHFKAERIDAYYKYRLVLSQNNFNSAVTSFEQVFTSIFNDKLNVDEAKVLIHNAVADPGNRDKYRNWLRIYTQPIFDSLRSIGLTHMQYHFADGSSFLRMHRPFYFGDDLSFRKIVTDVNANQEYMRGFENGRHLLAYRYVFPLEYEGEHIGSVELSVGVKQLIEVMNRLYGIGYSYLLEKDKIFNNDTAETLGRYENLSISDEYFMETCDACVQLRDEACSQEDIRQDLIESINGRNRIKIRQYETFAEISPLNKRVLYSYMPIIDRKGTGLGYIMSHSIVRDYAEIQKIYDALFIFISIGAVSLVFILFALDSSRRKTLQVNTLLEKRVADKVQELREKEQFFAQQSKMVTMGEMLASILHQWKQPLNSITLIADLLLFDCGHKSGNQEMCENLQSIKEQANFMNQTGNDFRNFMRPSKQKLIFNIADAVEEVLKLFEFSFTRFNIGFEKDWDESSGEYANIYGYPNEFKHVLLNIFNNSRDAIVQLREEMVEAGEDVSEYEGVISISIETAEDLVIVKISDTGGGIPDSYLERIFDKYFSTKKEEGSGIGLFMSKEMVQTSMNGTMTVKNIIGGAEFTLTFPKPEKE